MQWTPDMLRAFGVGEQGVQQVFSQSAPVPRSGPFPNYTPYTQTGSALGVPPNAQAVVPRTPTMPAVRTTGGLPITDAQYRPVGPQRQIGYTPTGQGASSTTSQFSRAGGTSYNMGGKMYQGGKGFGKAAPLLSRVAKAGIGGAGGAVLTDMLFPDSANEINDVAMINKFQPLKSHNMTTPQAAEFPALQQMPNQAQFEAEFRKSQEMKKSDYGKIPGTGTFQVEGGPIQYLMGDAAKASGGFSRPSTADANLAREEAEYQQSREISARRAALDAQELQQSLAQRAQSAIASGDYEQASALGKMLQQAGGLQIDDYGTQQLAQAQAKITPQQSQQKTNLESAQADYYRAQAAGLPQANAIKAAQALQKAKSDLAESDSKMLDAVLNTGDQNAIMALGAYPQFRNFVAAYLAAQAAAKE